MKLFIYRLKRWYHLVKTGWLQGIPAQVMTKNAAQKLQIICITGTDGKTTTSTLTYHILKESGLKVGLISTVGAYIGDEVVQTGLHATSPAPMELHRLLEKIIKVGCTHVVLETTSHGIYQHRLWGIQPKITGLTNITHEHLDYHINWQEYVKAKWLLLRRTPIIYLNAADASFAALNKLGWPSTVQVKPYTALTDLPGSMKRAIIQRYPQPYNQANATLAALIALELGVGKEVVTHAISQSPEIPGRMQVIQEKPFKIIVDFAHTPNALESVLSAVRAETKEPHHLISVFGCAGLRDHLKRPKMGKVAATIADLAVFTAEDPRTENIWSIIREMKEDLDSELGKIVSIADRREAIKFAIAKAKVGDCIVISGKGHEQSMCIGTQETPWHDPTVVAQLLKS